LVEQGLHVTFNPNGCFVENMKNQGKLIAKGERDGQMFTLDHSYDILGAGMLWKPKDLHKIC
jgi:hypothetical protein